MLPPSSWKSRCKNCCSKTGCTSGALFLEQALYVLGTIHAGQNCILQNKIVWDSTSQRFMVKLHEGRQGATGLFEGQVRNLLVSEYDFKLLEEKVEKCTASAMVGVMFGMLGQGTGAHANMIVIDKSNKNIEIFEPLGQRLMNRPIKVLRQKLQSSFPGYTVLETQDVCPKIKIGRNNKKRGPQGVLNFIQPNNLMKDTCAMWSLWYLHIRLSNPRLTPEEAHQTALTRAMGLDEAALAEGLTEECARLAKDPKVRQECWNPDGTARPNEAAVWKKKCPNLCSWTGDTMVEFIVRFTQQMVGMVNITGYYTLDGTQGQFPTKQAALEHARANQLPPKVNKYLLSGDRLLLYRPLRPDELGLSERDSKVTHIKETIESSGEVWLTKGIVRISTPPDKKIFVMEKTVVGTEEKLLTDDRAFREEGFTRTNPQDNLFKYKKPDSEDNVTLQIMSRTGDQIEYQIRRETPHVFLLQSLEVLVDAGFEMYKLPERDSKITQIKQTIESSGEVWLTNPTKNGVVHISTNPEKKIFVTVQTVIGTDAQLESVIQTLSEDGFTEAQLESEIQALSEDGFTEAQLEYDIQALSEDGFTRTNPKTKNLFKYKKLDTKENATLEIIRERGNQIEYKLRKEIPDVFLPQTLGFLVDAGFAVIQ